MEKVLKQSFCFLILLNCAGVFSQAGNPFITNFQPLKIVDNTIFCIEHNENNIMFFGTSQGVLMYNGEDWDLIKTPNTVVSLKFNRYNNKLMVGLKGGAGYVEKDGNGIFRFHSLGDGKRIRGNFYNITGTENWFVFQSQYSLVFTSTSGEEITDIWIPSHGSGIVTSFYLNGSLHAIDQESRVFIFKEEKIDTFNIDHVLENNSIVFTTPYNDSSMLLGLSNGSLYIYNGVEFTRFKYDELEYASASILNGGLVIGANNTIVLSTLAGGVVLINMKDGSTKNIINFQSGLPDDEVNSIGVDYTKGIWISHLYGVSRVDLNFPVKSYHSFQGLKGNIFSLYKNDTTLFVGTNEGLFYYAREEHFNEKEEIKYVDVKVAVKRDVKNTEPHVTTGGKPVDGETGEKNQEESAGFLSRLFRKKSQKNEELKPGETDDMTGILSRVFEKPGESPSTKDEHEQVFYTYRKKQVKEKIYLLQSVTYSYKKISGFNEKVKEIVPMGNHLLLLTNIGLFSFYQSEIKPVVQDVYTSVYYLNNDGQKCYVNTSAGLYLVEVIDNKVHKRMVDVKSGSIYGITIDSGNNIMLGDDGTLHKLSGDSGQISSNTRVFEINGPIVPFKGWDEEINLYNKGALYAINGNELLPISVFEDKNNNAYRIFQDVNNNIWVTDGEMWKAAGGDPGLSAMNCERYLTVFNDINFIFVDNEKNIWVVDDYRKIFKLNTAGLQNYMNKVDLIIHNIENFKKGLLLPPDNIELSYNENAVEIRISAPFFVKNNATQYSYYIEGLYDSWSAWANASTIRLDYLPTGDYTLQIKARNIFGFESKIEKISLNILPPFWKTTWFYLLVVAFAVFVLFVYIKYRERKLRKERQVLEEKVAERTREIEDQKDRIEKQAIAITDSITYAQKIQEAMLPSQEILKENLGDYFILFMPRDIVSGDFYWAFEDGDELFLAAADCTGHGVPGAFMSMLGISFLNELVKKQNLKNPAEILNNTRSKIIESMRNQGGFSDANDGMDIAFCNINLKKKSVWYAGAYNPLVVVKNKNDKTLSNLKYNREKVIETDDKILFSVDAERMPVGNSPLNRQKFISHEIPVETGDAFYIFSDGYADQIGFETKKKYLMKNFKKKLLSVSHLPMQEQKIMLENNFQNWRGKQEQLDDVMVIGFRL